jgi:hypothetical protein
MERQVTALELGLELVGAQQKQTQKQTQAVTHSTQGQGKEKERVEWGTH